MPQDIIGWIHTIAAIIALIAGSIILAKAKGTFQHKITGRIYLSVYNLTDRRNEIIVYGDSGKSDETIEKRRAEIISLFEPLRPNTLDQYFNRPDWYDPPRQIQLGLQFSF